MGSESEAASAGRRRRLVYTFYSCGCAAGVCVWSGYLAEARYCAEGARLGRRAETYGKRLAEVQDAADAGMADAGMADARKGRAVYLLMVRAVERLDVHRRRAGIERGLLWSEPGLLPPPGNYVDEGVPAGAREEKEAG